MKIMLGLLVRKPFSAVQILVNTVLIYSAISQFL